MLKQLQADWAGTWVPYHWSGGIHIPGYRVYPTWVRAVRALAWVLALALLVAGMLGLTGCARDPAVAPLRFACWDNNHPTLVLPAVYKIELTRYPKTGVDAWRVQLEDGSWVTHDAPATEVCGPADPPPSDETG